MTANIATGKPARAHEAQLEPQEKSSSIGGESSHEQGKESDPTDFTTIEMNAAVSR